MSAKRKSTKSSWIDPDDAPELTRELADRAQIAIGGKVIREATGTLTKRGRPPVGDEPKQQVTLRLAPKVIKYFRATGDGWQTRLNETLEEYVTAAVVKEVRNKSVSISRLISEAYSRARADHEKAKTSEGLANRDATGRLSRDFSASKSRRTRGRKKAS